jgi:aspartyl-tRNA(Asn)/glutamyl-tRNA(Gln) amidotransferase subunit C
MRLSEKDVAYVARLARLRLTDRELKLFAGQFEKILSHMEELKKLDTANVPPTAHALGFKNVFREDRVEKCDGAPLLAAAPSREADFYRVQKVIE